MRDPELQDVLLKVRYPDAPGRDDLATAISAGFLFVATEDVTRDLVDVALTLEFPGLLSPVALTTRIVSRVAANPAAGQAAGLLLALQPATEVERERLALLLSRLRPPRVIARAQPFRLLLVDDSNLAHKVIGSAVARLQRSYPSRLVEVVFASTVVDAIAVLGRERVDMALVDGDDLVRAIRADATHHALPVLVIAGGGRAARDTAVRAGADLVLDKPLMLKPLLSTITALVTSLPTGVAP